MAAARTAVLVHFNEEHDYERSVDSAGNLSPLVVPAGLVVPASVDGIVGRARSFTPGKGYHAAEAVAGSTRLLRDLTIEGVAYLPWAATNGTYRILTRGKGTGSAAERELYGLQFVVTGAPAAPVVQLQMRWQRASGAAATVPAATFVPPAGWLYLAATRRWRSVTDVAVDYYCNGAHVGSVASAHGDIADGVGGTMMIGCDATTGMPSGSVLDELRVSREARTGEELRQIHRRLFVFPSYGYELLRSLMPPGDSWSMSEDSRIQRFFAVAGDALSSAWSLAAELLEDFLPDRAWSFLDRWEAVTRLAPRAADSIETRRARIVAFMRKVHGYTRTAMLDNVAELLDADVADLRFIEGSTILLDDFDGALVKPYWTAEPATLTAGTPPTVAGGELLWSTAIGVAARWDGANREAAILRTSVPAESGGVEVILGVDYTNQGSGNGNAVGLFVLNLITGDAHLFGTKAAAGTLKWYHATIVGGVYTETLGDSVPGGLTPGAHTWLLRYHDLGGGLADLDVQLDGTNVLGNFDHVFAAVPTISGRAWAGVFISDTVNPPVGATQLHASLFRIFAPDSPLPFEWAIYRDPALGGAPDMLAARQVIQRTKPAHTLGEIVESLEFTYDTEPSTWDRSLWGA